MAIAFKNTSTTVTTADTMQTMYTAPGGVNGSIVHAIYIANKLMTSAIVCSLVLVDDSATTEKYIMNASKNPKDKGPFPQYTLWYKDDELIKFEFINPKDKKVVTGIRKDLEND